jgi:hypothetical protein
MSKLVFRMRLPSPNLVVEVDEVSGAVNIQSFPTAYGAREHDLAIGGEGKVIELSEIVSKAFRKLKTK